MVVASAWLIPQTESIAVTKMILVSLATLSPHQAAHPPAVRAPSYSQLRAKPFDEARPGIYPGFARENGRSGPDRNGLQNRGQKVRDLRDLVTPIRSGEIRSAADGAVGALPGRQR